MFDTEYLNEAVEQYPDCLDELTGFTWFKNSVGSMIPTRRGIPMLVTGHNINRDNPVFNGDTIRSWFSQRNLVDDANDQGYSVGVYSDDAIRVATEEGPTSFVGRTINIHSVDSVKVNSIETIGTLTKASLYRNLPWALKPYFSYYTADLPNAIFSGIEGQDRATPYQLNDSSYYKKLTSQGISTNDPGSNGAYRFIHLNGAHYPYTMDENAQQTSDPTNTPARQGAGAIKIVSEYIRQLK